MRLCHSKHSNISNYGVVSITLDTQKMSSHELKSGWIFSFQQYGPWSLTDCVQFASVESFWQAYDFMPLPSLAFRVVDDLKRSFFKHGVERIRSLCMRRDTIKTLEWEDPLNTGMYSFRLEEKEGNIVDDMYEKLLLLAIGESFGDDVRAVRIVDKGKKRTVSTQFELWCKQESEDVKNALSKVYNGSVAWSPFSD